MKKKAFELFVENDGDKYIYVVLDEERDASGFFADYDVAKRFGIRLCKEYEMKHFVIEKQLVFKKDDNYEIQEQDYSGTENVWASYDKYGGLKNYYSHEIVDPMNYDSAEKIDLSIASLGFRQYLKQELSQNWLERKHMLFGEQVQHPGKNI